MSTRTLLIIFAWLVGLLALTIGLSYIPMGGFQALPAYLIAAVKALLVILYFMEVKKASRLVWVMAGAGFLWLGILLVLSMSDYTTRGWTPSGEVLNQDVSPMIPPPGNSEVPR